MHGWYQRGLVYRPKRDVHSLMSLMTPNSIIAYISILAALMF